MSENSQEQVTVESTTSQEQTNPDYSPTKRYVIPEWDGSPFQKWAKNFCFKNAWRVTHILGDYDDCLAKCAYDYIVCRKRYGATVNSSRHMMFCYTQWVVGEFNTLAVLDGKERAVFVTPTIVEGTVPKEPTILGDGELAVKLSEASGELSSVLKILFEAPKEMMETLREEAKSAHPKQAFKAAVKLAGLNIEKTATLVRELQKLLS